MLETIREWHERYPLLLPALIIIVLALLIFVAAPAILGGESTIKLKLLDNSSRKVALGNETLHVFVNGTELKEPLNTDFKGLTSAFKVPMNATIKVELESDDWLLEGNNSFVANEELLEVELVAKAKPIPQQKITISVQPPANATFEGKTIYLSLSCRNNSVKFPTDTAQLSNESGFFDNILTPLNCGGAIANVTVSGFQDASSTLRDGSNTIRLSALEAEQGQVIVSIFDASTHTRVTYSTTVSLVNQNTASVVQTTTTNNGQAQFSNVEQGPYYVTVTAGANFAQTTPPERFGLVKNAVKEVSVELQQNPAAVIQLSVKHSGQIVQNARVQVFDANRSPLLDLKTSTEQSIPLPFYALGHYTIIVDHADYITQTIEVQVQNRDLNLTVNLLKCNETTQSSCGQLDVTVEDEDQIRIPNATVLLYNADNQFLAQLEPAITDANGIARFRNVSSGEYFLKARKFPAENVSDSFTIDPNRQNSQTMVLLIGRGTFEVSVKDELENAVPNARVEFQTRFVGECDPGKCVTETDVKGIASYAFKADKQVFAIVKKEGYADFVTQSRQVYPNETRTVEVVLQKAFLGDAPDIAAPIILDTKGIKAKTLKAGQTYLARFIVRLPSSPSWSEAGFFVRAGDQAESESDFISIEHVDAGGKPSVLMGTTYNPPLNQNADYDHATLEHAKWTSVIWNNPTNGVYVIDVSFQIKPSAQNGQAIPLYYRAWATDDSQSFKRTPQDAVLGTSNQSTQKDGLYAESLLIPLRVGELLDCDTEVCLSNESLFDQTEQLFLNSPFTIKVFGGYEYDFAITNRSPLTLPSSQLTIASTGGQNNDDVIRIQSYEAKSPQFSPQNSELNDFETGLIDLGDLNPNESAVVHLVLRPEQIKASGLRIQLRAGNHIVFDQTTALNVQSDQSLGITTDPEVIGALFAIDMNIQIKDNDGVEVENAVIKTTIKSTDNVVTHLPDVFTNQAGKTVIPLAALDPGTLVTFEAQKENFESAIKTFKVDENILSFEPESLTSKLNLTAKPQEELIVEAQSKIRTLLTLTGARLTGRFYGLLDEDAMSAFLRAGVGNIQFNPDITTDYRVNTRVNANAVLRKSKTVNGSVFMEVKSSEFNNHAWRFELPLSVRIDVGQAVDNPGCLTIDLRDWTGSTLMGRVSQEFSIANNCTVNGRTIALNELIASLKWNSNVLGNVELSISDPETGSLSNQTLQNGQIALLWDQLRPSNQTIYHGIITFVPRSDALGETAIFEVNLDASVTTNSGETLVGSNHPINGNIVIQNLEQCLQFDPDPESGLRMKPDEQEKDIVIDASKCGKFPGGIKLRFCQDRANNTNCKGGTQTGGIELSTYNMTLSENSKTLTVSRLDMPGFYGLTVEAKVGNQQYRKLFDYPVIIQPRSVDAFALDRYTYTLIGANSKDAGTVFNRLLEEDVHVKTNICVYSETIQIEAAQNNLGEGLMIIGGLLTTTGLLLGAYLITTDKFTVPKETGIKNTPTGSQAAAGKTNGNPPKVETYTGPSDFKGNIGYRVGPDGTVETRIYDSSRSTPITENVHNADGSTTVRTGFQQDGTTFHESMEQAQAAAAEQQAIEQSQLEANGSSGGSNGVFGTGLSFGAAVSIALAVIGIAILIYAAIQEHKQYDEKEICRQYFEETYRDFVINLRGGLFSGHQISPDAGDVGLQVLQDSISTKWNLDIVNNYTDAGKRIQEAGVVFSNDSGLENPDPLYDVLTIRAKEHIHGGNTLHDGSAKVQCDKAGFANYYVTCDESTQERVEQIHIQFKTAPIENRILPVEFDTVSCAQGSLIGRTGPGAVPKVKLNWSWNDFSGITRNSCDARDENAIYCDSTQFSIMLAKRLHALDQFLAKNNYFRGVCPTLNAVADSNGNGSQDYNVPAGKVGISSTFVQTSGATNLMLGVTILNNSSDVVNPSAHITVRKVTPESADSTIPGIVSCDFTGLTLNPGASITQSCTKTFESGQAYFASFELGDVNEGLTVDQNIQPVPFVVQTIPDAASDPSVCPTPKTTGTFLREPVINYFVNQAQLDGSLEWAPELGIANKRELTDLLHFNALLMKDGFSVGKNGFRQSFVNFYQTNILDAPEWFTSNNNGLKKLWLAENDVQFTQKYFESPQLPAAGTYAIDVALEFKDDWKMVNEQSGELLASGKIQFYLQQEPFQNTAFYDLPLDGAVGMDGSGRLNRQEFGTQYVNEQLPIALNQSPDSPLTWNDTGSFALQTAYVRTNQNFEFLNSLASTRGNLLEVKREANEKQINFTPTYATPLLMEVSVGAKTTEPVSTFYQLTKNSTPIPDAGRNAFLWSGANNCRDFSGTAVTQTFADSPDRQARQEDSISGWQTAYGLDWERVDYPGKIYLRTITYTQPGNTTNVQSVRGLADNQFFTADETGKSVSLNGISAMHLNAGGNSAGSTIKSLQDVFDLVENGYVCVTNTGTNTRFWWNPEKIYTTAGRLPSLHNQQSAYEQNGIACVTNPSN